MHWPRLIVGPVRPADAFTPQPKSIVAYTGRGYQWGLVKRRALPKVSDDSQFTRGVSTV